MLGDGAAGRGREQLATRGRSGASFVVLRKRFIQRWWKTRGWVRTVEPVSKHGQNGGGGGGGQGCGRVEEGCATRKIKN